MPNWRDVLGEVQEERRQGQEKQRLAFDTIRRKYLQELHKFTGRNVIAYYSGWLSKQGLPTQIIDEDKNGFMMAVHRLDRSQGLDLLLHTEGGEIGATQSIVDYLHKMFGHDIRAIIPQIAMSAGTMIACSCSEIVMATHSNLGPIDPQLHGLPAFQVIREFQQACREVKQHPHKVPLWQAIIGQYEPTFLGQCQTAIKWSNGFVEDQLRDVMLRKEKNKDRLAKSIVKKLAHGKVHDSHLHYEDCADIGLKVTRLEDDPELQDLVLTVHHCYMHTLMNTASYKMTENHLGLALVKQASQ